MTRGVLLDFVHQIEGADARFLEDGHNIGLAEVEACLKREGVELSAGDAVFTYTGLQHRLRDRGFTSNGERQAPGLRNPAAPLRR